ncbi:MAG: hypothetical protein AMXMBFR4_18840 [Candidatus Hydrogenedentota bacterium]
MKVSVIIPARNAEATLAPCVEACLAQSYADREIIVVDDGSSDSTPRIAREFHVRLITQPPRGPAAARNTGARAATGDILAFTDSDCIPRRDWLENLARAFADGADAVGGTYDIANPESALASLIDAEIRARHGSFNPSVDFLGSFNMAVRKDAFDGVLGFDESFTAASGEDNDLSYRLADHGYRLRFVKEAVVSHFHPTRLMPYLRTQARHGFWRVKLYTKHLGRARGDDYAGPAELLAPSAFLFVLVTGVLVLLHSRWWLLGLLPSLFWLVLYRMRLVRALMTNERRSSLYALAVFLLRDAARALGMVAGVCYFILLRGKSV